MVLTNLWRRYDNFLHRLRRLRRRYHQSAEHDESIASSITVVSQKSFNGIDVPEGETIVFENSRPIKPSRPIIPFIPGDGIGKEIWPATQKIIDAAVSRAYTDRNIVWMKVFAGEEANANFGEPLPADTMAALRQFRVAIKGPLATPSSGGMRSLNVAMRNQLDLYRCVRPVRWYKGVPSRVVAPEELDIVIFRMNKGDLYGGIEFEAGSAEQQSFVDWLEARGIEVPEDSGLGIKVISEQDSKQLVRSAIEYAIEHRRKVVTLVAKGNIMKFTEGAFRKWGYEVGKEFGDRIVTEDELWNTYQGKLPDGKILLNDRITDAMFAELILRPNRYSVIATMNLNGDYLSDACAAQVGGLGLAPGANIGDDCAIFEATHGTAPDIAGKNIANPTSLILSAVMMLQYIGWHEAADLIVSALEKTLENKTVTGDLARLMSDAKQLTTSEFADAVVANLAPATN